MKQYIPQWLQDLQESSWELELLISGGAIFSLLHASDFFTETIESIAITNSVYGLGFYLLMGAFAIQGLTIGFILHLLLRSFWLAMVCISYVYPNGPVKEKIGWKRPFDTGKYASRNLYEVILKTDALCGLVIYISIISTFLVAGLLFLLIVFTLPIDFFGQRSPEMAFIYFWLLILVIVFYILDLLFFGFLRRMPVVSWLVYPVFRLFDLLSLRFILQRSLWIFNTNINKPKLAIFFAFFFTIVFFISLSSTDNTSQQKPLRHLFDQRTYRDRLAYNPRLTDYVYLDELQDEKIRHIAIPSKIIDKNYLDVFLIYRKEYDYAMQENPEKKFISDLVQVSIDDSVYHKLTWHSHWRKENDQMGITTMVPIQNLTVGQHLLKIASKAEPGRPAIIIPFWKEEK